MFGIGAGPSKDEKSQFNKLSASSDFSTGLGESDLTASSNFMQGLLSGDPTKVSAVIAPQVRAIQDRTQQDKNKVAQFNDRSGGGTATVAGLDTAARGDVASLVGSLTGNAASTLGSEGAGLLSTGMAGNEAGFGEAKTMHDEQLAKINDIIKGIAAVAAAPFTGGASLGGLTGGGSSTPFSMPHFGGGGSTAPYGPNSD